MQVEPDGVFVASAWRKTANVGWREAVFAVEQLAVGAKRITR